MQSLVMEAIFARFPEVKREYMRLLSEGYRPYHITYDALDLTNGESVDLLLSNDGEYHRITQGRRLDEAEFSALKSKRINAST